MCVILNRVLLLLLSSSTSCSTSDTSNNQVLGDTYYLSQFGWVPVRLKYTEYYAHSCSSPPVYYHNIISHHHRRCSPPPPHSVTGWQML